RVLGVELAGLHEHELREAEVPLVEVDQPEVLVGLRVLRRAREELAQGRLRLLVPLLEPVDDREVVQIIDVVLVGLERLLVEGGGAVELAPQPVDATQVEDGALVARVRLDGALVGGLGGGEIAELLLHVAEVVVRVRQRGIPLRGQGEGVTGRLPVFLRQRLHPLLEELLAGLQPHLLRRRRRGRGRRAGRGEREDRSSDSRLPVAHVGPVRRGQSPASLDAQRSYSAAALSKISTPLRGFSSSWGSTSEAVSSGAASLSVASSAPASASAVRVASRAARFSAIGAWARNSEPVKFTSRTAPYSPGRKRLI